MARCSLSDPDDVASYLAYALAGIEAAEPARITGSRWAIEECFQAAKNECGLDEYEVSRYSGRYRHIAPGRPHHSCRPDLRRGRGPRRRTSPRPACRDGDSVPAELPCRTPSPVRTDVCTP